MENKNEGFQYTYSAKEQTEIRKIREKYTNKEESKIEKIRRLDTGVTRKAQAVSLIFGIIGALILGFGMSLIMTDLSEILGSYSNSAMLIGIIIGILGCAFICFAYPMYNFVIKQERKKVSDEIIRLTDELMK